MITGQISWMPRRRPVPRPGNQQRRLRGIAAGERTCGRLLVIQKAHRCCARHAGDNGQSGSLLDTLTPRDPRYTR